MSRFDGVPRISGYYPDDLRVSDLCYIEGCVGHGRCPRCGSINYALMGYHGAVASAAKRWGTTKEEAERRIEARRAQKEV